MSDKLTTLKACIFPISQQWTPQRVKRHGKPLADLAVNLARHHTDTRRVQMLLGHWTLLQFEESDLRKIYDAVPF